MINRLILWVILMLVSFGIYAQNRTPAEELETYIRNFTRLAPNKTARALSYIPLILASAERYKIDHMLIAVIISGESSWSPDVVGGHGEIGLMQVMGRCAADGCELKTPQGQIDCGCQCLRNWIDRCGGDYDMARGLNGYGSGKCYPILKSTKRRIRLWQIAVMGRSK